MKNLVILGASRSGKTTLAREVNKQYPNYHIINGDSIRHTFERVLPQNEINKRNGKGMREDFAKFSAELFKNEIKRNNGFYNYIFDSCDISVENAIKYFKDESTIIIYLGYSQISEKEALSNYRKYEKSGEWTFNRTDEELLIHAKTWINNSKIFKSECELNNIKYIDTSYDREKILENLKIEIIKELV